MAEKENNIVHVKENRRGNKFKACSINRNSRFTPKHINKCIKYEQTKYYNKT